MTLDLTVKYDSTAIDDITDLVCDLAINSRESCSFHVPNPLGQNFATWKAREYSEKVEVYRTSDDKLLWDGFIVNVVNSNPAKIECKGIIDSMDWDIVSETDGAMIIDSLKVQTAPTTEVRVVDSESDDPGLANDQYNVAYPGASSPARYAIISDTTMKENDTEIQSTASSTITGGAAQDGTTHTNTQSSDGVFWEVQATNIATTDLEVKVHLDLEGATPTIPKTAQITRIRIQTWGNVYLSKGLFDPGWHIPFSINWSKDQSSPASNTWAKSFKHPSITGGKDYEFRYDEEFTIPEGTQTNWFTEGGTNLEDGALIFKAHFKSAYTPPPTVEWHIDYVNVIVYFSTATFEQVNRRVRDTINDGGGTYDIIKVDNDAADGFYDLTGKGIAANDSVDISIGILEAFSRCNSEYYAIEINEGTDPNEGTTQNYVGISYYTLFQQLCDQMNYEYFASRETVGTFIRGLKEEDIDDATVTYDKDNDPFTWMDKVSTEGNEYGFVVVQFYSGQLTGKIVADTPSSNPRTKLLQAKWILTRQEAEAYGKRWANYYALDHYNIPLTWQSIPSNFPEPGVKYNITALKWSGSEIGNESYEDQICRRTSITWAGGLSKAQVRSWMGGGKTEPWEKNGMWEGLMERKNKIDDALSGTSQFTAVTRHAQLLGIGTSDHHTKYTDAEAAAKIASDALYMPKTGGTFSGEVTHSAGVDGGTNDYIINAPTGKAVIGKINDVEKMRLDTDDLSCQTNIKAKEGHSIISYSAGNDKNIQISHNDSNGQIINSSGDLAIQVPTGQKVVIVDTTWSTYEDFHCATLTEHCEKLECEAENWKELLPAELKSADGDGIKIGKVARLALRENTGLKIDIKKLQDNIMIINETMKAYALKLEELADRK